jgi:hypothetical protein
MHLLFIPEKGHFKDWVGKTYSDIISNYIENTKNTVDILYKDDIKCSLNYDFKNKKPDMIIFFTTDVINSSNNNIFDFIFNLGINVAVCSLDLFYFEQIKNDIYFQKCNTIIHFGYASKLLTSYKEVFPQKNIVALKGRFINTHRFKNYGLEKKYDILIYGSRGGGSIGKNRIESHLADIEYKKTYEKHYGTVLGKDHYFYPLRIKLEELLCKNSHKYKLKILDNACIFNAKVANEDLSKLINESYLTLSCCTRADIAMAKYFEIPASYSAILGDIPSDYEDLFKGNIVEVTEWMTDEEILNIIDKALEDKEKLWEMTKRLGDRVHIEYNLDAGVKDMDKVFNNIISINN